MFVSRERPTQTDERLKRVAAAATLEVYDGTWWYDEFPLEQFPARVRADAVAVVHDADCWSQLVPERPGDDPAERFRIWRYRFPDGVDNSGFIGWLASRIKASTGSGVLVVCGQNASQGGIYDYWGCPVGVSDAVIAEIRAVASESHS